MVVATLPPPAPAEERAPLWGPFQGRSNPRQREAILLVTQLPEEEYLLLGYGGAAGGGKSVLIANMAIRHAIECPGSRQLIGRRTLVHLRSTTLATFDKVLQTCYGRITWKRRDGAPIIRYIRLDHWPPGLWSEIVFMQVENARDNIGSEEFSWCYLDEAHEINELDARYLFTRLRHAPEVKRGMVICFNPFPSFAVEWFIDQSGLPDELTEAGEVLHLHYVPARLDDNRENLPPNYERMMYGGLDEYLRAVMIEGRSEAVPNAIFGELWRPELIAAFQVKDRELLESTRFLAGATGWDWGTSRTHQAAGCLLAVDNHDLVWVLGAWESPFGSSDELEQVAKDWLLQWGPRSLETTKAGRLRSGFPQYAHYDASQGSLRDDLDKVYGKDTSKPGIRDVDGRIRRARGILAERRWRFNFLDEGVRKLWRYLQLYHRDDDGKIVEKQDDMVDAFMYALGGLPTTTLVQLPPGSWAQGMRHTHAGKKAGKVRANVIGGAA